MNNPVYITGHKNPDTDSVCSALAYANLKNILGTDALAGRLGPLNEETKYVLNRFGIEHPLLLKDARSALKDIQLDHATTITPNTSCHQAWMSLFKSRNKSLFVVENEELKGVVTTSNLANTRMMNSTQLENLMKKASFNAIVENIEGRVIYRSTNFKHNGKVFVATLVENVKYRPDFNDCIVLLSDGNEKQKQIVEQGARLLVVTCGEHIHSEVLKIAREKNCAIIETDLDTMKVAQIIYDSFPISEIMTTSITTFNENEFVEDVAVKINKTRYRSYPVVNEQGKLIGAVSTYHTHDYEKKHFILVDHSEKTQTIDNLDYALIDEIIDHHHIGSIQTTYPIYYRNQKCGCTATIVYQMYKENGIVPSPAMAGLMMSAIISDTLLFKSQTTTPVDIALTKELAQIVGVNVEEYGMEMLSASVALKDTPYDKIINRDLKTYKIGKYKVGISQTNYSNLQDVQTILEGIKTELQRQQKAENYDLLIMMFTHVMATGSMFVYYGKMSSIMVDALATVTDEHTGFDEKMVSRKQQVMPKISAILQSI